MINTLLIAYALTSLMLGALQLLNRNAIVCRSLSSIFLILQVGIAMFVSKFLGTSTGGYFTFDGLGVLFTLVLTIVALAAFCHSRRYIIEGEIAEDDVARAQYYGAMTILTMALTMATLSNHIAMTWIFVELTTLSASALIFYRRNAGSIEATWKYVFACSISLVLVYVGILLVTISMGPAAEDGLTFDVLMQAAPRLDTFWLKMAFVFIFVGYTAKMSLVPMFTAGIDAKDKAPTPASAMLSTVVMNVGFVGFYRVYAVVAHTSAARWAQMVVLLTGLVSIFVAAVYLVRVKNVKRLFAYSSVEHAGVAMLGVAAGGVGLFAAVLHLVLSAMQDASYLNCFVRITPELSLKAKAKLQYSCAQSDRRWVDAAVDAFWQANFSRIKSWYPPRHREDDVVISASPEFLIRPACAKLGIRCVIGSPVDKHTGHFLGPNCHGAEKVSRFHARFPGAGIDAFYSDSHSDDPLAALAKEAWLVKGERLEPWGKKE